MSATEVRKLEAVKRSLAIANRVTSAALVEAKKSARSASPSLTGGKKRGKKRSSSPAGGKKRRSGKKRSGSPKRK